LRRRYPDYFRRSETACNKVIPGFIVNYPLKEAAELRKTLILQYDFLLPLTESLLLIFR